MLVEDNVARVFRWQGYSEFGSENFFSPHIFHFDTNPLLHQVQESGKPLLVSDVQDYEFPIYGIERSWIKSHICAPIFVMDQLVGILNVDSANAGFFDHEDVDLLQAFTSLVSTALKNAQLYDQARQAIVERVKTLRKERNFADAVLNTAGALVMVLNPQGRILRFNRACEQATGYIYDEVKGQRFWDLFVTTDQLATVKSIFAALQGGELRNEYESFLYTKDRRKRLVAWSNTVLLDQDGVVEFIISSGVDITERRQLRDRLLAIHDMGRELNLLHNENEILQMTLETAAFLLEFKGAGYGMLNETTGELTYYYHPVRGVPQAVELTAPVDVEKRINLLMAHSEQGLEEFNGAQTLPVFQSIDRVRRAWLSVPMKIGERTIGVIDVQGYDPDSF
jgi:PAS domain S-box-containing protein